MKRFIKLICAIVSFLLMFQMEIPTPVQAKSQIDIVFIIDRSGSMQSSIDAVKNEVGRFTDLLKNQGITYRLGLISYEEYTSVYPMTSDVEEFKRNVQQVYADGGTENGLDAIQDALEKYTYQVNSTKYFVLIGDEIVTSRRGHSVASMAQTLANQKVILTAVGINEISYNFKPLCDATGGLFLNLYSNFGQNLTSIFEQIQAIPIIHAISPEQDQRINSQQGIITPMVEVSDPDSDTLTTEYYLDAESTPRERKVISNTKTKQTVVFSALNTSALSDGEHVLRFTVNDGRETVEDPVRVKVDRTAPQIGGVNYSSTYDSITISGWATDSFSGMNIAPYRYTIGAAGTEWNSNSAYMQRYLTPNIQYMAKFEARDSFGNVAEHSNYVYTKAQIPQVSVNGMTADSITLATNDYNPAYTQYQVNVGSYYVNSSGYLTSTPTWITLTNKTVAVKGLPQNNPYQIKVKAQNAEGIETGWSSECSVVTLANPPANISTVVARDTISLSWTEVPGIFHYDIEVDGIVFNTGLATNYVHRGLTPNTPHNYRVRAVNAGGPGSWSNTISKYTLPNPPAIPNGLTAEEVSQNQITVVWDTVLYATGYQVQINNNEIINIAAGTKYTHSGLSPDTEYTYRVRAVNAGGESPWSDSFTIITLPIPPDTPANISTRITKDSVAVSWNSSLRATSYEIEADTMILGTNNNTTYLHEGLQPLTPHTYRVRAVNRGGKSPWSAPINVTTHPDKPVTPTNIMATSDKYTATVTWYKVPHAESYDIEIDGNEIRTTTDLSYLNIALTPDSKHTYRVRANNVSGCSQWSSPVTVKTLPETAGTTMSLTNIVAVVTNNFITLSWDTVASEAEYFIEVDDVLVDIGKDTQYNHTGLNANEFHTYKVRVKNAGSDNDWCAVLSLSTLPNPPDAPTGVEAVPRDNSIELRWSKAGEDVTYDIEVDGQVIDNGASMTYNHRGLASGTSHTYRVRAKNITGVTAWSSAVTQSTTSPTYTVNCTKDKGFDVSLIASNVQDFSGLTFIVTYNKDELDVIDLCGFTPDNDTVSQGNIKGTNLYVTYTPGRIELTVKENIIPGTSWSGEISNILFKAKISGPSNMDIKVEQKH